MYFNHTSAHLSKKTVSGFAQAAIADDKSVPLLSDFKQSLKSRFGQMSEAVCNRPDFRQDDFSGCAENFFKNFIKFQKTREIRSKIKKIKETH